MTELSSIKNANLEFFLMFSNSYPIKYDEAVLQLVPSFKLMDQSSTEMITYTSRLHK